jgi:hypothetical protein
MGAVQDLIWQIQVASTAIARGGGNNTTAGTARRPNTAWSFFMKAFPRYFAARDFRRGDTAKPHRHTINHAIFFLLAEKGGSRTLRGPYGPQTGFEDQRHHRAPSFSIWKINYLRWATRFPVTIPVAILQIESVSDIGILEMLIPLVHLH